MHARHSGHADGIPDRNSERNAKRAAFGSAFTVDRAVTINAADTSRVAFPAHSFAAGTGRDAVPMNKWMSAW